MHIIVTLIIGGIVGWLASIIMRTNAQMGIIANVVVGIVGAFLGKWLVGVSGMSAPGQVASFAVAIGGAVLLIAVLRALGVFNRLASAR